MSKVNPGSELKIETHKAATVAIIGGGFSGLMTAVHLARQGKPVKILLVNKDYPLAKGVAYSAPSPIFLLNVRAGRMSAFPNEPDHFVNWLQTQPDYKNHDHAALKDLYAPRKLYGTYLKTIFEETCQHLPTGVSLQVLSTEATGLSRTTDNRYQLTFTDHPAETVDFVVLALGNFEPAPLKIKHSENLTDTRYIHNPWRPEALSQIKPDDKILLVGTGLTMIDIVLWLRHRNHAGNVFALSPRGLLPLSHKHSATPLPHLDDQLQEPYDLLQLFKVFRKFLKDRNGEEINWTMLIEALRPKTQNIWLKLSVDDRKRFLRHLASAWSISRHRIPGQVFEQLQHSQQTGNLTLLSARLTDLEPTSTGLQATIRKRGKPETEKLEVQWVINCTGPQGNYSQIDHPLVQGLLADGYITPDPLLLGLNATATGQVIDKQGKASDTLLALGPPLRGILWESTAVNEIRGQAEALGKLIGERL